MILEILIWAFAIIFWVNFFALVWTYFGYPLLMYLRSKIARLAPMTAQTTLPTVTLVIPTFNEADVIRKKLENAISLDYPADKLTVFVIDDDSTDETQAIVREFAPRVTLIPKEQRTGKMQSVNKGVTEADSDIIVLSDASPIYETESLKLLVAPFADPKIGVVVGTLAVWDADNEVAKPAGLYWKYEAALRRWESNTGNTVAVHGNMFALRRELYQPFSEHTINDEFSIAMSVIQQGYRVVYEPRAISYDHASSSMKDEFKRRVRINAGRYQALFSAGYLTGMPTFDDTFRLFSHKFLRPITPILMLLVLIANVVLLFLTNFWLYQLAFIGQIAFYTLAAIGFYFNRIGKRNRLLNIFYFFVSSNVAALFGFWRWLTNSQSVTWQKRDAVTDPE